MEKVKIGNIVGTHALKGELKIRSFSDFNEKRFVKGSHMFIKDKEFVVESIRYHKSHILVSFENHLNINLVEQYVGQDLYANKDTSLLEEDEYYISDILGCNVYENDELLGKVTKIINSRHDILVVGEGESKIMIPYVDEFIVEDNIADKIIKVRLIEGMKHEN